MPRAVTTSMSPSIRTTPSRSPAASMPERKPGSVGGAAVEDDVVIAEPLVIERGQPDIDGAEAGRDRVGEPEADLAEGVVVGDVLDRAV